jgi:hypothetical protein
MASSGPEDIDVFVVNRPRSMDCPRLHGHFVISR